MAVTNMNTVDAQDTSLNMNVVNFSDFNGDGVTKEDLYNSGTEVIKSEHLPSYVDDVVEYESQSAFPATGETGKIYVAKDTNKTYRWSGSQYIEIGGGSAAWGDITGTLANQTDLQTALDGKLPKAVPTAEQGSKEYLYSFAGETQNTDIAVTNDMRSGEASYTDRMVPTSKSVAILSGGLENLETTDKDSLVDAINEINSKLGIWIS